MDPVQSAVGLSVVTVVVMMAMSPRQVHLQVKFGLCMFALIMAVFLMAETATEESAAKSASLRSLLPSSLPVPPVAMLLALVVVASLVVHAGLLDGLTSATAATAEPRQIALKAERLPKEKRLVRRTRVDKVELLDGGDGGLPHRAEINGESTDAVSVYSLANLECAPGCLPGLGSGSGSASGSESAAASSSSPFGEEGGGRPPPRGRPPRPRPERYVWHQEEDTFRARKPFVVCERVGSRAEEESVKVRPDRRKSPGKSAKFCVASGLSTPDTRREKEGKRLRRRRRRRRGTAAGSDDEEKADEARQRPRPAPSSPGKKAGALETLAVRMHEVHVEPGRERLARHHRRFECGHGAAGADSTPSLEPRVALLRGEEASRSERRGGRGQRASPGDGGQADVAGTLVSWARGQTAGTYASRWNVLQMLLDFFIVYNVIAASFHWFTLRNGNPVLMGLALAATLFLFYHIQKKRLDRPSPNTTPTNRALALYASRGERSHVPGQNTIVQDYCSCSPQSLTGNNNVQIKNS